jgi:hypothetical protein
VDSHRRVGARRWRCEIAEGAEQIGREVLRRARAQHLAVFPQESDIMGKRRGSLEFYITVRPSTVLNRRDLDFSSAILKLGMIRTFLHPHAPLLYQPRNFGQHHGTLSIKTGVGYSTIHSYSVDLLPELGFMLGALR